MLHSFSLFRIANMLENWHQMDGNWLETIKHACIAHMRLLPFSCFSMKLGVINSFLVVCLTMVQKKYSNWKIFTKFLQKYHVMAIEQYLGKTALLLQLIQDKIHQLFSHNFDRLSIL